MGTGEENKYKSDDLIIFINNLEVAKEIKEDLYIIA